MINNKKKRGSSLVLTVAMFAILSILIMSVLAMTTSGYTLKIKYNKRIENFYGADSGLEISQKIVYDIVSEAVKYAKDKIDNEYSDKKMDEKEGMFKYFYIEYLRMKTKTEKVPEEFKTKIEADVEKESKYKDYSGSNRDDKGDIKIEGKLKKTLVTYKKDSEKKEVIIGDDDGDNGTQLIDKFIEEGIKGDKNYKVYYIDNGTLTLNVKSNFKDKNNNSREVEMDIEITIPDYGKSIISARTGVPNILNYIVGVDGDYIIDATGSINVMGDMWVKGNKPSKITKYNKYDGGITIKSSQKDTDVIWKGDIVTPATLKIENTLLTLENTMGTSGDNPNKILEQNVYAGNVVIDNNATSYIKPGDYIGSKHNLFVFNDFILNGTINPVSVKNYYGLNDINNVDGEFGVDNTYKNHLDTSSSMMINDLKTSDPYFKVANDAYILGASYLDLGDAYQTGQSTVINQLTRPYTERSDKYIYTYKGDLHIVDKKMEDGKNLELADKAELVKEYYNNTANTQELALANGFTIGGNLYNAGAVLATIKVENKEKIHSSNTNGINEKRKFIYEKQKQYAEEVFNMGEEIKDYNEKDFWKNRVKIDVDKSFLWSQMFDEANTFKEDEKVERLDPKKEDGFYAKGFIHLRPKMKLDNIMARANNGATFGGKKHLHPLGTYASSWTLGGTYAHVILNATDKEVEIISKSDGKNEVIETENKIIYKNNIGEEPLLVISKGNIISNNLNGSNHNMLISAGTVTQKLSPAGNIGNYATPSQANEIGYEVGQAKLINELFKFILEDSELLGSIGNSIFGIEEKETENNIDISEFIKSKNWKLNK